MCVVCHAAHLARLRSLSSVQRRALLALDRLIPRHVDDLRQKGVRWRTLASLMQAGRHDPALAHRLDLRRPLADAQYYTFALLTRRGADMLAAGRKAGVIA